VKKPTQFTSIGGQAVIEGVMMRSPHFLAVAVRKPDKKIKIKSGSFLGWAQRHPFFKKPVLRGVVLLIESMGQGIKALSYSANVAAEGMDDGEPLSTGAMIFSIASAIVLGLGLFVALPHLLTALAVRGDVTADSPWFHLLDGLIKMLILVAYVFLIALMKDIRRVFQYHGAEHKSIFTFEAGQELTVANARTHSTLHPRCGTSFLLFLVLISVLVFSAVFPFFGLTRLSPIPILNHTLMVFVKIGLMLPIAGLAYEFIKAAACRMHNPIFRALVWPGLILQKLTTREPDDEQLEVALASLRIVLLMEKNEGEKFVPESEQEISSSNEIAAVQAQLAEFPEA